MSCLSFQVAVLCMSQGKLEEKYKGECHIVSVSTYIQHVELCVRSIGELCEKDCVYFTSGLFKVIARNQDSIDLDQLTEFLEQAMQVEQIISCHFPPSHQCQRKRWWRLGTRL